MKAYALQDKDYDTVQANVMLGFPADIRSYDVVAAILKDLGIKRLKLMRNNPKKEKLNHKSEISHYSEMNLLYFFLCN